MRDPLTMFIIVVAAAIIIVVLIAVVVVVVVVSKPIFVIVANPIEVQHLPEQEVYKLIVRLTRANI